VGLRSDGEVFFEDSGFGSCGEEVLRCDEEDFLADTSGFGGEPFSSGEATAFSVGEATAFSGGVATAFSSISASPSEMRFILSLTFFRLLSRLPLMLLQVSMQSSLDSLSLACMCDVMMKTTTTKLRDRFKSKVVDLNFYLWASFVK